MKIFQSARNKFEILKSTNPVLSQIVSIAIFFVILLILIGISKIPELIIPDPVKAEQATQILGVIGWFIAMISIGYNLIK